MAIKDEIEQIFRSNYRPMLVLAKQLLHDEDAARDIVHDVFASLLDENPPAVNTSYLLKLRQKGAARERSERPRKLTLSDCQVVRINVTSISTPLKNNLKSSERVTEPTRRI